MRDESAALGEATGTGGAPGAIRLGVLLLATVLAWPRDAAASRPGGLPGRSSAPAIETRLATPPAEYGERSVTVALTERNASGIVGAATLSASDGSTIVLLTVDGPLGAALPALLYQEACDALAPAPAYPLTDAFPGMPTTTVVATSLDRLLGDGFAVAVFRRGGELAALLDPSNVVACGQIAPAGDESVTMPRIGTGSAGRADRRSPPAAFAALALALAAGGVARRRREGRG